MILTRIKKYLRDIPSAVLMIIGLAVSYFILLNAADFAEKMMTQDKTLNGYKYSVQLWAAQPSEDGDGTYENMPREKLDRVINCIQRVKGANARICDVMITYNNEDTENNICDIYFNTSGGLHIKNTDGKEIKIPENTKQSAVLGETIADYFNKQGGRKNGKTTFKVNSTLCTAIDVRKNNNAGNIDNTVTFFWDNCGGELRNILENAIVENTDITIKIESNNDIEELCSALTDTFENELGLEVSIEDATDKGGYQNEWYEIYNRMFIVVSLLFSIFTCFSVSELWAQRRKREFAMRRAFGYSDKQLLKLLFGDLAKLSVPAIAAAAVMQLIYCAIFDIKIDFSQELFIKAAIIIIGAALIMLLTVQRLIYYINKTAVADMIRGE